MNRRGFFKLAAGAAAVAFIPISTSEALPVFVGDGKHDDTEAIQAAADGQPFEDRSKAGLSMSVADGVLMFGAGANLVLKDTLHLGRGPINSINFGGAEIAGEHFPADRPVFMLGGARRLSNVTVANAQAEDLVRLI